MLPVLDAFEDAVKKAPPTNEREESMHKNFGSLYTNIVTVVEKYGYKLFEAGMLLHKQSILQQYQFSNFMIVA